MAQSIKVTLWATYPLIITILVLFMPDFPTNLIWKSGIILTVVFSLGGLFRAIHKERSAQLLNTLDSVLDASGSTDDFKKNKAGITTAEINERIFSALSEIKSRKAADDKKLEQHQDEINQLKSQVEQQRNIIHDRENQLNAIQTKAHRAQSCSNAIFTAVGNVNKHVDSVSLEITTQQDRIESTAAAMEQMNASVMEVANNATLAATSSHDSRLMALSGAEDVGMAMTSFNEIKENAISLEMSMGKLDEHAENIGQIMTIITDIADQTNLLALNAAIEAARAGDAGRGFAVVADEVRKLAEKTMDATSNVGEAVEKIQHFSRTNVKAVEAMANNISSSTDAIVRSGEQMQKIVSVVENTNEQVQSIAAASDQQSVTSEEINMTVSSVAEFAQTTSRRMGAAHDILSNLNICIEEMDSTIQMISVGENIDAGPSREIEWSEDFSVGVKEIDKHHKDLIKLINRFSKAVENNEETEIVEEVAGELLEYTHKHFKFEEELFDKHGYKDSSHHKKLHKNFLEQVLNFKKEVDEGKGKTAGDLIRFLKDWVVKHILVVDGKYAEYMKENGYK